MGWDSVAAASPTIAAGGVGGRPCRLVRQTVSGTPTAKASARTTQKTRLFAGISAPTPKPERRALLEVGGGVGRGRGGLFRESLRLRFGTRRVRNPPRA